MITCEFNKKDEEIYYKFNLYQGKYLAKTNLERKIFKSEIDECDINFNFCIS